MFSFLSFNANLLYLFAYLCTGVQFFFFVVEMKNEMK